MWSIGGLYYWDTYFLIMFPSVWSSLFIVNIAAFVTLVSNSLMILEGEGGFSEIRRFMMNIGGFKLARKNFIRNLPGHI